VGGEAPLTIVGTLHRTENRFEIGPDQPASAPLLFG
jgi:hypothetical protein